MSKPFSPNTRAELLVADPALISFGTEQWKLISKEYSVPGGYIDQTEALAISTIGCLVRVTRERWNGQMGAPSNQEVISVSINFVAGVEITETTVDSVVTARALSAISGGTDASLIGAIATQPVSGSIAVTVSRAGNFFALTFTLVAARVPVTDGGGSGSSGTLKLFNFVEGGIVFLGSRQNYTATVEGALLDGAAGDAVYVWGVGSASATTARDGTLTGTEQDIGTKTSQITNVAGTGAGTIFTPPAAAAVDGTSAAKSIWLNWSGTAATIDATDYISVTGTITVVGAMLGDD